MREDLAQSSVVTTGAMVGGDLKYGLSRNVMAGLGLQSAFLGAPGSCRTTCGGAGFALEAFVAYHVLQGLSVDPWIRYGAGFRNLTLDAGATYSGFDWLNFRVGADYFLNSNFGLGAFFGTIVGHYLAQSDRDIESPRVHVEFLLGLSGVVDIPGK